MSRTDYYDDPDAPTANSLRVAASAVVQDDEGRVLLHRRTDNGRWALPGGGMDVGESIGQAAAREVLEETGYVVEPEHVIGVYSDPKHVSDESHDVAWFTADAVTGLDMHPRIRARLTDHLAGRAAVVD